jgi:type II secretory pathway pseudopilin PulG
MKPGRRTARFRPSSPGFSEDGFILLELLVTMVIFATIMASTVTFLIGSGRVGRQQTDMQTALQIAVNSMEDVSLLPGAAVVLGRTETAVRSQWQQRASGLDQYMTSANAELVWTDEAAPAGVRTLPTIQEAVRLDGESTIYKRHWYVSMCWQPRQGGSCVVVPQAQRSTRIAMYRVVVAIVWPSSDCESTTCFYATELLTAQDTVDPLFY